MSVEDQGAAVRQWLQAWNEQDLEAAAGLLAPDYSRHDANLPDVDGPKAGVDFIVTIVTAFPDLHLELEHLAVADEHVLTRLAAHGTHTGGAFMGVPTTGREVTIEVMEVYRFADGKIAEQWVIMNALRLLQQLGAIPS